MQFWATLWELIWFVSLGVFSLLSVLVIVFGGRDLAALLASLRARHLAQHAETPAGGDGPARTDTD